MNDVCIGIDLGTTNSAVAALDGDRVRVLGPADHALLPSVVGVDPSGGLLIGAPARNQQLLHPERTLSSVKRLMGTDAALSLGERTYSPQEVSALILRRLAEVAAEALGQPVTRAVITVPAYFSDAQRSATREAGRLAGLEVVRVLNEPTAASLAYGATAGRQTVLVYDLGGGTFDVSIVAIEGDVTEVLASHGDTQLGGDDFDALLAGWLTERFAATHGIDAATLDLVARSRLRAAAEEAKIRLSSECYTTVREASLLSPPTGPPLHLELEVSRDQLEALIAPLLERTLERVGQALADAGKTPADLDEVLLVGGSTRIPRVAELLALRTGRVPRREVHPDLCVALGAGLLGARLSGNAVERVLVDVSPYSFGPSYLGERGGVEYPHCYQPIIDRNTPLPVTQTRSYYTADPYQEEVEFQIFQGEDPDALRNVLVGEFSIVGLEPAADPVEVLCRMALDLDGILQVSAIEKRTGLTRQVRIEGALRPASAEALEAGRARLASLYDRRVAATAGFAPAADEGPGRSEVAVAGATASGPRQLLARARASLDAMHPEDREDAIALAEALEAALAAEDAAATREASEALAELLFFVEGGQG